MRIALALLFACFGAVQALAEEAREGGRRDGLKNSGKRHSKDIAPAKERREIEQHAAAAPNAQTLGRDQSGVYVNAPAANTAYSPTFVMRGFPTGVTLFDGASHGFTAQDVDLSTVDHVEFYKGPSAMLLGKALGGYGGAANYIRKSPTREAFARAVSTLASFSVRRLTVDVNAPLDDEKSLLFRMTGSVQSSGSFVNFVRARSFDVAPMLAFNADNGDRLSLRAEHNGGRLVWRDGVPVDPAFLHIPSEFYAGLPANEHEMPLFLPNLSLFKNASEYPLHRKNDCAAFFGQC